MSRHLLRVALRAQQSNKVGPVALRARSISPVTGIVGSTGTYSAGLLHRQCRLDHVTRAVHTDATGFCLPVLPTGETIPVGTKSPLLLRPYQQAAIDACLAGLGSGLTRIGISVPIGSGKTTMFISLIPRILPPSFEPELGGESDDKGRTLILVSRKELVTQVEVAARNILGGGWSIEVEQGGRVASGKANITIAMRQSIIKPERLAKYDPAKFKLVIVEEAYHAGSVSYRRLLHHFNSKVVLPPDVLPITSHQEPGRNVPILGFSATFSKPDGERLARVFERIVFHVDMSTMIREGWLAPAQSTSVYADLDLDAVPIQAAIGDFQTPWLADKVNTPEVNQLVVKTYLEKCRNRRSTLVFCINRQHAEKLSRAFQRAEVDARWIGGITSSKVRAETLHAFKEGEFPVLVAGEILLEGTDIPEIDCMVLARPTKSANLLTQMLGRGLRHCPRTGKTDCLIFDVVDSLSQGLTPIAILGSLPDEDKDTDGGSAPTISGGGRAKSDRQANVDRDKVKMVDEFDPFGIRSKIVSALPTLSKNAWVACKDDYYALELFSQGCIVVERLQEDKQRWTATYHPLTFWTADSAFHQSDPTRSSFRLMGVGDGLGDTIELADKFVSDHAGSQLNPQLSRYAQWRSKPASEKQVQFLRSLGGQGLLQNDEQQADILEVGGRAVELADLTAGEVHSLLCAFKHGQRNIEFRHAPKEASNDAEAEHTPDAERDLKAVASVASTDKPFYKKIRDFLPAFLV